MKLSLLVLLSTLALTQAVADEPVPAEKTEIRQSVMHVLDEYMATFNRLDMAQWESTMHFPHYRLASGKMQVQQGTGELSVDTLKSLLGKEWHHSRWEKRRIIHLSASKVHIDTTFSRLRQDGSLISSHDSLYIMTLEDGRWGVKMRSSMAP